MSTALAPALVATITHHAAEAKARIDAAQRYGDKQEEMMRSAGHMIAEANRKVVSKEWPVTMQFYLDTQGISRQRANECYRVYTGALTVEQWRASNKARQATYRQGSKEARNSNSPSVTNRRVFTTTHQTYGVMPTPKPATATTPIPAKQVLALRQPHNQDLLEFLEGCHLSTIQQQQVINFIKGLPK